jgi:hypothetical protein
MKTAFGRTLARDWRQTFGTGMQDGMWGPVFAANGREYSPIGFYTSGRIVVLFRVQSRRPFNNELVRLEVLRRVNAIPGVSYGPEVPERAWIQFSLLAKDVAAPGQLKRVLEWIAAEAGKTS